MSEQTERQNAQVYYQAMKTFSEQTQRNNTYSLRVYNKTSKFIIVVSLAATIAMIYLIILETNLEESMAELKKDMVEMYQYSGDISHNVERMNGAVKRMHHNVAVIPTIAEHMTLMSNDMTKMTNSIDVMQQNLAQMQANMSRIKIDMQQMGGNFSRMTGNVNNMSYNIHQMSRPMRIFP